MKKILGIILALALLAMAIPAANAAAMANGTAVLTTATAGGNTDLTINFTTVTALAAADNVYIGLGDWQTLDAASVVTVTAGSLSGNVGAAVIAGKLITLPVTANAGAGAQTVTVVGSVVGSAAQNPAVQGQYAVNISTSVGDYGAAIANVTNTVAVTVNVAGALEFAITSGTSLVYNLDPVTTPSDITKTTGLSVRTNAGSGYNVTYTVAGGNFGAGATQIPLTVAPLVGTGSDKGFYVTSAGVNAVGGNRLSGQTVMNRVAGAADNNAEIATVTNRIAVDWTVNAGNNTGATITYTATPTF